jgi:3-deoxy-D-manno-octulosonate 8-phosphate phosphatase KdsC-like HAD superfamily phosphatase
MDELLEKLGAGAIALPIVGDDERDLCVARAGQAVEPADADDVVTVDGHHRLTVVMVDVSEVLDL